MTDLEKTKKLFKEFGINPVENDNYYNHKGTVLIFEAKSQTNIEGYTGFEMLMMFTKEGKFERMGIWE